jgi:hypothetical protein
MADSTNLVGLYSILSDSYAGPGELPEKTECPPMEVPRTLEQAGQG